MTCERILIVYIHFLIWLLHICVRVYLNELTLGWLYVFVWNIDFSSSIRLLALCTQLPLCNIFMRCSRLEHQIIQRALYEGIIQYFDDVEERFVTEILVSDLGDFFPKPIKDDLLPQQLSSFYHRLYEVWIVPD